MLDRYAQELPLIPGAVEAVQRLADRWPLGLASSSNRELIDRALEAPGLAPLFRATCSSEEVARGKPAPDVYSRRRGGSTSTPARCAAVEDSAGGIRSAPPRACGSSRSRTERSRRADDALALAADVMLPSIGELTPEIVASESS